MLGKENKREKYTVSKHTKKLQQLKWCGTGIRNIKKFNATEYRIWKQVFIGILHMRSIVFQVTGERMVYRINNSGQHVTVSKKKKKLDPSHHI